MTVVGQELAEVGVSRIADIDSSCLASSGGNRAVGAPMRLAVDAMQVGKSPAGIGRYIIELLRALDSRADESCEITAYTSRSARALTEWSPKRVKVVPVGGGGGTGKRILRQQFAVPGLVRGSADLVHYPDYLTAIRNPAPSVVTIHDLAYAVNSSFYTWPQRMLRHLMHPLALRSATIIVVVSEFTRRELLRLFPDVAEEQIRVVYNGIRPPVVPSEELRTRLRERFQLPDRFVLSVCTREPRKNLGGLLHAFGRCPELQDEHLVLVGRSGWGRDSLSVLDTYGPRLTRRVTVTGYLDDAELAAMYHLASTFVYIPFLEGFGLPPLEALSCGAPVVASDIPVLHEMLGSHVLYVDPHDVDSIGEGIRTLLADRCLGERLVASGTQHALEFTWERCAGQMLDIYREAAAFAGKF